MRDPDLTTTRADGVIVLEWWHDPKKLTVYLGPRGGEFIKTWGGDPVETADGDLDGDAHLQRLLDWLDAP